MNIMNNPELITEKEKEKRENIQVNKQNSSRNKKLNTFRNKN